MPMRGTEFSDFLLRQTPVYDKLIMRDITVPGWLSPKPWLDHLAEDARFLPNRLVKVYLLHCERPKMREWQIARRLKLQRKTVKQRLDLAWDIIDDGLKNWLKSLPMNKRRREVYKRRKSWRETRLGIKTTFNKGTWPDLTSDWKPVSNPTPVGEQRDPWSPMRHWDD